MSIAPARPREPVTTPGWEHVPLRNPSGKFERLRALFWSAHDGTPLAQTLAAGAVVWAIYAAAYVAAHGVYLDESVVPAQIITGAVQYPAGHPHQVYYTEAYSLGNYLSAAVLQVAHSVWLVSALRNWLTLFCATYLPYSIALLLTGAPLWGHVAGILTLTEASIAFQGVYPLWIFPATYSTGNTSLHIALLAAVFLLAGLRRCGGVLLGLLPSIHPALALLTWAWTAAFVFVERTHWPRRQLLTLGVAICVGMAVCVALGGVILLEMLRIASNGAPPYVPADINGDIVRREYIALSDVHRRLFDWPSVAYLLNPAAFAGVSGLLLWSAWRRQRAGVPTKADTHLGWIVLLGGLAWLVIYAAGVVQAKFGSLPDLVATLMPYRLSNVTALLLIPLAVSGIAAAGTHRLRARPVIWAALGLLLVVVGVRVGADRDSVFRNGLYIILGAFLAVQSRSSVASVGVLAVLGAIAWKLGLRHEVAYLLGTWAIVLAFLVISEIPLRVRAVTPKILRLAAATVLALGCIATTVAGSISPSVWNSADMLFDANGNPSVPWDAMSPYDQALGDWLRTNSAPNDLILSAVWPRSELQAKVGHPVLFELETLPLMTYLPSVAGSTGVLARDLYGLDYSQPDQLQLEARSGQLNLDDAVWSAAWMTRSRGEWHALAQKYSFHLVLAPTQTRLDLPVALPGPVWTLYTIP